MRQVLYGPAELLAVQYRAIERLLVADVFELRYSDLDWAIDRLRKLVREGH
jgi:stalled ribosome rescue protein Dom34